MTGSWPRRRIALLALVSAIGIGGMLLAEGGWDWLFLALAALPLLAGGAAVIAQRMKAGLTDWLSARSPEEGE